MSSNGLTGAHSRTVGVVVSVLMIVAGLLAIGLPFVAGLAMTGIIGWLLIFGGIIHLMLAWRAPRRSIALWEVLIGAVYGLAGFYLLTRPVVGLASLTLALAAYLLVESILEFVLAAEHRAIGGNGWLIVDGVITLILALMIGLTWPFSSAWAIGTLIGISILFSGISRLMLTLAGRRQIGV